MNEEQIAKAKEAKSAEELLALAKEYGMEDFTEKNAEELFEQLHTSGELTDEEMENVAGGCSVKVNGKKFTVVTAETKCQSGYHEDSLIGGTVDSYSRTDSHSLRDTWHGAAENLPGKRCGTCVHLGFKNGIGFCEVR